MKIMDCTLRDGGNVLANGFPADLTSMMLTGLLENGISIIEYGNAKGLGAESFGFSAPLSDTEYLEIAQPYIDKAEIGMFMNTKRYNLENVKRASDCGLSFLRVGADAGDGHKYYDVIEAVKLHNLKCRYALMKAYILSPEDLATECAGLEAHGVDEVTIMDSAGCMLPQDIEQYVRVLKARISIPVGFHCHNNLGMAAANALVAIHNNIDVLDCGLLGMARSAGNLPTEIAVALAEKTDKNNSVDFLGLLNFLENQLVPAMEKHGYHTPIKPLDLILGYSGCHSSFVKTFQAVAKEYGVDVKQLIISVSKIDKKSPIEELMRATAEELRREK